MPDPSDAARVLLPGSRALIILFLVLLVFNLFLFPARTRRLRALSGVPNPVLDVRFGYSSDEAYAVLDALGPEGRRLYATTQVTLDLAYPVLYSLLLAGMLALVLPRAFPARPELMWLAFVPFLMAFADIAENLAMVVMMLTYPPARPQLAHVASLFTMTKWILGGAVAALLLAGLLGWLIRSVPR